MSISVYIIFFMFAFDEVLVIMLNQNELKITFELSTERNINYLIFVQEKDLFPNIKGHLSQGLPTTFKNYEKVIDFLKSQDKYFFNVMFVFKEKKLLVIKELLQKLKMKILSKISRDLWLAFVEDSDLAENDSSKLPFRYDCEFLIVQKNYGETYKLTEIFSTDDQIFFLPFGLWDSDNGLKISDSYVYSRRKDLNQTVVPFYAFENEDIQENNPIEPPTQEIIHEVLHIMNMKYKHVLLPKFDEILYEKIMKEDIKNYCIKSEAEFLLAGRSMDDITNPILKVTVHWYIKYPNFHLRSDFYLQPFERNFWFAILVFIIIGTIFVFLKRNFLPENEKRSVTDDAFLVLEYFCNQNGSNETETLSLRILGFTLLLLSFVVLTCFGALVTSYVSAKSLEIPFGDLQTFMQNGKYRIMGDDSVIAVMYSTNKKFNDELENFTIRSYDGEGIERICNENLAFAEMDAVNYRNKIPCPIYRIEKPAGDAWLIMVLSCYNPFKTAINYHIIRFYESGVHHRLQKLMVRPYTSKKIDEDFESIELEQMWQMLFIILIGILLATLVVVTERLVKYCKIQGKWRFKWSVMSTKLRRYQQNIKKIMKKI